MGRHNEDARMQQYYQDGVRHIEDARAYQQQQQQQHYQQQQQQQQQWQYQQQQQQQQQHHQQQQGAMNDHASHQYPIENGGAPMNAPDNRVLNPGRNTGNIQLSVLMLTHDSCRAGHARHRMLTRNSCR